METKVTTIEESKDFSSLSLDELTGNLKVYEMVIKKDFEIIKGKKDKYKSIALKAKMESSGSRDPWSHIGEDDEVPKKDEVCLMAQNSNELESRIGTDEWIHDSESLSKRLAGNKNLFQPTKHTAEVVLSLKQLRGKDHRQMYDFS
ncbi:hypothetical protein Tco_0374131 [Tanacetum coccineum]